MPRQGKNGPRTNGAPVETIRLTGITQGAGGVTSKPFGAKKRNGKGKGNGKTGRKAPRAPRSAFISNDCWDAFHPRHLALPRAVAPYTVIRTTAIWNPTTDVARRFVLFGPMMSAGTLAVDGRRWTNSMALGSNKVLTTLKNDTDAFFRYTFTSMHSSSWSAASVTPAAFSIQILNPEALAASVGMCYVGRCHNKVHVAAGDLSTDIDSLANELVSYSEPRMCSAGKLALRGVQIDAVPNNMSELALFTTLERQSPDPTTLASNYTMHHEGFNPIFLYNPNAVDLQVLVCCEWRVRFDPSNPAYSACSSHRPSTDIDWFRHLEAAVKVGHGVVDLADKISRYGANP